MISRLYSHLIAFSCLFLVIVPLFNAFPTNVSPGTQSSTSEPTIANNCARFHTIEFGDTCVNIGFYNSIAYSKLLDLNPGLQCDELEWGKVLCVSVSATPTDTPTDSPTDTPTDSPTDTPTDSPTDTPTDSPTDTPTDSPTDTPTDSPTDAPTDSPTDAPTDSPTDTPTATLTDTPTTDTLTDTPTTDTLTDTPTATANDTKSINDNPKSADKAASCSGFHTVIRGENCSDIARNLDLTWEDFITLNPTIQCDNLQSGDQVCVAPGVALLETSTETMTSIVDKLSEKIPFVTSVADMLTETVTPVTSTFTETVPEVPNVVDTVTESVPGISAEMETLVESEPTTTTLSLTPTATESLVNVIPCMQFHTVITGDTCFDIAQNATISWMELQGINPGIRCDNLQPGDVLCTDRALVWMIPTETPNLSSPCMEFHTIKSGDTCLSITQDADLSWIEFRAKNQGIQCNALHEGDRVCVR